MRLKGYSNTEMAMLARARDMALESNCRQRVGAVVVKGGRVLAAACNRDYNDPAYLEDEKVAMHASICAERRALALIPDEAAKGAIVYVVRAGRNEDNAYACSKPCKRCEKVLKAARVKRVVYID